MDFVELLIEHKIDVKYFDPKFYPELPAPWMAGLQKTKNVSTYYTAYGNDPIEAVNNVLIKCGE